MALICMITVRQSKLLRAATCSTFHETEVSMAFEACHLLLLLLSTWIAGILQPVVKASRAAVQLYLHHLPACSSTSIVGCI